MRSQKIKVVVTDGGQMRLKLTNEVILLFFDSRHRRRRCSLGENEPGTSGPGESGIDFSTNSMFVLETGLG